MYMLDTNTCIFAMKQRGKVLRRLLQHEPNEICISSITYAELCHGIEKSERQEQNRLALLLFLSEITILPYDAEAAEEYGKIRATLELRGTPIGPMDMLIASHAKATGAAIVTTNLKEFQRIPSLQIEDWA